MSSRRLDSIFLFVCLSWGSVSHNLFAGQPQSAETTPAAGANRRITLDVAVTDKSGAAVAGLQEQDFSLLDNKQPQKILSFAALQNGSASPGPPIEVVLLVDAVNTSFTHVSFERLEIEKFLRGGGGQLAYPTSIVVLTDTGSSITNAPTRDGNALIKQMAESTSGLRTVGRSQGVYGADERVQISLRGVEQLIAYEMKRPGRKLLIWISPGWPLLSGPRIEIGPKNQENLFKTIVNISDGLRRARITLDSVDPLGTADAASFRTSYYKEFVKPIKKSSQVKIGNVALQVLATQSGGLVLNSSNDIAGLLANCIADANAFYTLSFDSLPGDGPNDYHSLDVKINKPGAVARTRSGYYAQP